VCVFLKVDKIFWEFDLLFTTEKKKKCVFMVRKQNQWKSINKFGGQIIEGK
jgi:hypothetical protein|tara:strand:+ start:730 stop:882 length:153 start_codon:yes stop_codon:yes gene_type:complete